MSVHETAREGFGRAAEAYERSRPGYPEGAIAWLAERLGLAPGRTVVDLAAGTGKLTAALVVTGADVTAVEPVAEMLEILRDPVPTAQPTEETAEDTGLPDGSADAVAVAQASTGSTAHPRSPRSLGFSARADDSRCSGTSATSITRRNGPSRASSPHVAA